MLISRYCFRTAREIGFPHISLRVPQKAIRASRAQIEPSADLACGGRNLTLKDAVSIAKFNEESATGADNAAKGNVFREDPGTGENGIS